MTTYGMLVEKEANGSPVSWNGILPVDRVEALYGIYDAEGRPDPQDGVFGQGARHETCHISGVQFPPGSVLRWIVASPGGFGSPLDRDPEHVLDDVINERVSVRQAEESYGVILDGQAVDADATTAKRDELRAAQQKGDWEAPISVFKDWPLTTEDHNQLIAQATGLAPKEAAL
jgi:N-methylhydantoinase B